MKIEKKLVRGLADLSPLFRETVQSGKTRKLVSVKPPSMAESELAGAPVDQFICLAPLIAENNFSVQDEIELMNVLSCDFQHSYFIAVDPSFNRYEKYSEVFPIPSWEKIVIEEASYSIPVSERMSFSYFPRPKFEAITSLKPFSETEKKKINGPLMAFLDGEFMSTPGLKEDVLNLLDFAVLVFTPSVSSIVRAYQYMREGFSLNRKLRFLTLVVGDGAEDSCEFIYEQFNHIVSKFVGCDVGLLGWIEGGRSYVDAGMMIGSDFRSEIATSSKFQLERELCGAGA